MRKRTAGAVLAVLALLPAGGVRAGGRPFEPVRELLLPEWTRIPIGVAFAGGHLVLRYLDEDAPGGAYGREGARIVVLDRGGRTVFDRAPGADAPDAVEFGVAAATVVPRGELVVSARMRLADGTRTLALLRYALGGRNDLLDRFVTNPVSCVELGSDATDLWCLGIGHAPGSGSGAPDLVYRFSAAGEPLGSVCAPGDVSGWGTGRPGIGPSAFAVAGGGGALWWPLSAQLLRWDGGGAGVRCLVAPSPPGVGRRSPARLAVLADGTLVAFYPKAVGGTPGGDEWTLYTVGRDGRSAPVKDFPNVAPYVLVGGDGADLVFFDAGLGKLLWIPGPSVSPTRR